MVRRQRQESFDACTRFLERHLDIVIGARTVEFKARLGLRLRNDVHRSLVDGDPARVLATGRRNDGLAKSPVPLRRVKASTPEVRDSFTKADRRRLSAATAGWAARFRSSISRSEKRLTGSHSLRDVPILRKPSMAIWPHALERLERVALVEPTLQPLVGQPRLLEAVEQAPEPRNGFGPEPALNEHLHGAGVTLRKEAEIARFDAQLVVCILMDCVAQP
jgi:hypothetical protein